MTPPVVVIDADASIRDVVVALLQDEGYTPLPLDKGEGALDVLKRASPLAIIIDLRLGRSMSGLDVLAQLEQDATLRSVPVLVCSADTRALREQSPQLLARGYGILEKPFDIDDLLQWLDEHTLFVEEPVTHAAHEGELDGRAAAKAVLLSFAAGLDGHELALAAATSWNTNWAVTWDATPSLTGTTEEYSAAFRCAYSACLHVRPYHPFLHLSELHLPSSAAHNKNGREPSATSRLYR